jgi:hypothetical protein
MGGSHRQGHQVTAREVLDGIKAQVVDGHVLCEDCGKCRVSEWEEWCGACEYWSCERGPDCSDFTTPTRLIAAVEAVLGLVDERATVLRETADRLNQDVIDRDIHRDPEAAVRYSAYAAEAERAAKAIRAAIENALNP